MNRIQGFGTLLAELFLQIQVGEKIISAIGLGLLKILQIILKNETEKGVKSVCQILKVRSGISYPGPFTTQDRNLRDNISNQISHTNFFLL